RGHEMDLDVGAAVAAVDRPQDAASGAGLLVGEDVVDLVSRAAALGDPAYRRRPRGRWVVHLPVRRGVRLVDVVLAILRILGEAEVDEGAVPCVSQCHTRASFASVRPFPLPIMPRERRFSPSLGESVQRKRPDPSLMIVAPSCTATSQSWLVPMESRESP